MWSDSDTLTDAPIAISGNDATFAGSVTANSLQVGGSTHFNVIPSWTNADSDH